MSRSKPISGFRALAAAIGRSPSTAHAWTKHPDWPFGSGPWPAAQLPRIVAWAAATFRRGPAGNDARVRPEIWRRRWLSLIRSEKIKQAKALREMHRSDECLARRRRQVLRLRAVLLGSLQSQHLPPPSRQVVHDWLASILDDFEREYLTEHKP